MFRLLATLLLLDHLRYLCCLLPLSLTSYSSCEKHETSWNTFIFYKALSLILDHLLNSYSYTCSSIVRVYQFANCRMSQNDGGYKESDIKRDLLSFCKDVLISGYHSSPETRFSSNTPPEKDLRAWRWTPLIVWMTTSGIQSWCRCYKAFFPSLLSPFKLENLP